MKKGIIAISILCTGLLLGPIKNISFANKNDNTNNMVLDSNIEKENNDYVDIENIKDENKSQLVNQEKIIEESDDIIVDKNNDEYMKDNIVSEEITYIEENIILTKNLAENILKSINSEIEYLYQGDETNFIALQETNLSGYVFLPNVDGDMGYFVDKNNSDVYLFHPSGYLELIR